MSIIYNKVKEYTKCNPKRIDSLISIVHNVINHDIKGDFLEAGVYKGGACMSMAYQLKEMKEERDIWLYDTFEGMPKPDPIDMKVDDDTSQLPKWEKRRKGDICDWCYGSLEEVKTNMEKTQYNKDKIHYVKGKVEDTLKHTYPDPLSILRLDTDFYSSTKVLLDVLYPLLVQGGYLIIDDYGVWQGAKKAADEYFGEDIKKFTHIDHSCVVYKKD